MTATTAEPVSGQRGLFSSLIHRQLDSYPDTGPRVMYLAITVLATIMLYYELYVGGSVSTLILDQPEHELHVLRADSRVRQPDRRVRLAVRRTHRPVRPGEPGRLRPACSPRIFVAFILPAATNKWVFTIESFVVGVGRGHLPGRHAGADPRLLPAGRPGYRDGLLDQRPGARQPDRRDRRQRHDPDVGSPTRGSGRTSTTSAVSWAWSSSSSRCSDCGNCHRSFATS